MNKIIEPIAYIRTDFAEKFGVPRQSGRVPSLTAKIIFTEKYSSPDYVRDIEGFSHLWLIFGFSLCDKKDSSPLVRPPRLGGNKKIGVFASRSPFRPNGLGLSSLKLENIEKTDTDNKILIVSGADLVDRTPIYDIKPYLPFTDCHVDAVGGYADEHVNHKLNVIFDDDLICLIPPEKRKALIDCLKEDPRPSYQNDSREYGMTFAEHNVKFYVTDGNLIVTAIDDKSINK